MDDDHTELEELFHKRFEGQYLILEDSQGESINADLQNNVADCHQPGHSGADKND